MNRGIGVLPRWVEFPTVVVVWAALVTQLGDVWFVFLILGSLYWLGTTFPGPFTLDRTQAAFALALGLGARTLTTTLKQVFQYPRPPGAGEAPAFDLLPAILHDVYVMAATANGFGFPSGHAITATIVYGGLAMLVDSARGYATALGIIPVVAFSRVILGVHYGTDVLGGMLVGGIYLLLVFRFSTQGLQPGRALFMALVVAAGGLVIHINVETVLVFGGILGAWLAWIIVETKIERIHSTTKGGVVAWIVGIGLGGLVGVIYIRQPPLYATFTGSIVIFWSIMVVPLLPHRFNGKITTSSRPDD